MDTTSMLVRESGDVDGREGLGYWRGHGESDGLPDPAAYVDEAWDAAEREAVAAALEAAPVLERWRGYSTCRLCGCANGSTTLGRADGPVWPSGLAHYVRAHAVRPPADVVAWLLER